MELNLMDRMGDWNPQFFREIKGRLKPRNLTLAVASSLLCQLLLLMFYASKLPNDNGYEKYSKDCLMYDDKAGYCVLDNLGNFVINWQMWSLDVFIALSIIGIFAMLVVGTYMVISDLSREEHRGTLNFIRLSPRSTHSILIGKLLGVPILLYIAGALAIPGHLLLGLKADIHLSLILSYYGVIAASCCFFYSASLLYGLLNARLGGLQGWVGSGSLLLFLLITTSLASSYTVRNSPFDWFIGFSPSLALPHLIASSSLPLESVKWFKLDELKNLQWFYLPIGTQSWSILGLMLLNYGIWTYWVWQGLERCFHNSSATIFSKRQSYLLTVCFEVSVLGFTWQQASSSYIDLQSLNLLLFLVLIAALSPHRQALQDWARYRHQQPNSRRWGIVADLLWGEESPALVAVALNVALAVTIFIPWILLWASSEDKTSALLGLLLTVNLILISACVAQLMLLMKTPKRGLWAASTVGGLIVLPPIIFLLLSIQPTKIPVLWLFSAFGWLAVKNAGITTVLLSVLGQWLTLTVLGIQLKRQVQRAGESATKALFAGRPVLPISK